MKHNERARVAPQDFLKILFVHRKKCNAHTTLAWCLVRLLAVVGLFWARSLARSARYSTARDLVAPRKSLCTKSFSYLPRFSLGRGAKAP